MMMCSAMAMPSRWMSMARTTAAGRTGDRDEQLARIAKARGVRLVHWPLWRLIEEGIGPLVSAVCDGNTEHLGHADPRGYVTWRAAVYGPR